MQRTLFWGPKGGRCNKVWPYIKESIMMERMDTKVTKDDLSSKYLEIVSDNSTMRKLKKARSFYVYTLAFLEIPTFEKPSFESLA